MERPIIIISNTCCIPKITWNFLKNSGSILFLISLIFIFKGIIISLSHLLYDKISSLIDFKNKKITPINNKIYIISKNIFKASKGLFITLYFKKYVLKFDLK